MGPNNLTRPSDAYMPRQNSPLLACHLFSAKPLSEPKLAYCQLDPSEESSVKHES